MSDLLNRAISAYFRFSDGSIPIQPSQGDSGEVEFKGMQYVRLSSVNGTIAVYRVRNDGQLKRLKRWPLELDDLPVK